MSDRLGIYHMHVVVYKQVCISNNGNVWIHVEGEEAWIDTDNLDRRFQYGRQREIAKYSLRKNTIVLT